MNYVGLYETEEDKKRKRQFQKDLKLYEEELKKDIINIDIDTDTNNCITIFINFSQQSNGYCNFLKDKNILNKCIKIYFLKRTGITYFIGPLYVDETKMNKIYSVIGHMTFDYYTDYFEVIDNYIKTNSISNYLIYY
jgi:hypothetical protein